MTKLAIDLALTDYARAHDLAAIGLRYFTVAGACSPATAADTASAVSSGTHLVPLELCAARGEGGALSLYGSAYPTRDASGGERT